MSALYDNSSSTVRGVKMDTHITVITHDEYLKHLNSMSKTDREFMSRVRSFCEENTADSMLNPYEIKNLPVNTKKGASEYRNITEEERKEFQLRTAGNSG